MIKYARSIGPCFFLAAALLAAWPRAAPAAEAAADPFEEAVLTYRDGRKEEALAAFLRFLTEAPENDKRGEEAIRYVWQIAQEIKKSEESLRLDPKLWRHSVQLANEAIRRRRLEAKTLMTDLDKLDAALAAGAAPLNALRVADFTPSAARMAHMDEISRALAERRLADIRDKLKALADSPSPNLADLHEIKGFFWLYQGDLELAVKEWQQALTLKPQDGALAGRLETAKTQWTAQKNREEVEHELLLGQSDYKAGRFKQAEARFQRVIAIDPGNEDARRYSQLSEATAADVGRQERVNILLTRSREHSQSGKLLDAVQDWVDILVLDPGNTEARRNLERVRKRLTFEKLTPAPAPTAAAAKSAPREASNPGRAQEAYYLGLIEYTDGDLKKAQAHFEEALRYQPDLDKAEKSLEQVKAELGGR